MFWWWSTEPISVRLIKDLIGHPLFKQRKQAADLGYPIALPLTIAELLVGNQWESFFTTLATDAGRTYVRNDPLIAQEVFDLCLIHRRSELYQIFPGAPPLLYATFDHDYCQLDQTLPKAYAKYRSVMAEFPKVERIVQLKKVADHGYTQEFINSIREKIGNCTVSPEVGVEIMEMYLTCQGLECLRHNTKLFRSVFQKLIQFLQECFDDQLKKRLEHVYHRLNVFTNGEHVYQRPSAFPNGVQLSSCDQKAMSKRNNQAPASRPKRQIKAPERFAFDKKFGYSDQFQKSIKEQLLKDVDEDWDKDESSVGSEESEEFSSSQVSEGSDASISSKDGLVEDEDEFQGTHDSDLASDEIVDLNNLPSDSDSEEDESDGYEASESD